MIYLTEPLNSSHNKSDFNFGKELLDRYLHFQAKQDVKRKLAACFVLVDNETKKIKGYYTLANAAIHRDILPEVVIHKLPLSYKDLPATLLGRLAVDKQYHGKKLGELLLTDALKRTYDVTNNIGSMAVITDPIDESAINFYKKYGFILLPNSGKMFLPMSTIKELF